jgi:hypothetical protein
MNMKSGLLAVVAVVVLGMSAPPAHAWGELTEILILNWPGYHVYPPGTTFEQQIVNDHHAHWYQQQVPTVVPRVTYKLETTKVKTYVYVPTEVEDVQSQVTYVPEARIVDEAVTTTILVPFIVVGPSGTPIVSCRPEIKTHLVARTIHAMKPVVKNYKVKTTRMVPRERITEYQQIVPVLVYDQALTLQWQQTQVPTQRIVNVPVYYPHHAPANFWP